MSTQKKSRIHRINHTSSTPVRVATGGMLATLVVGGAVAVNAQKNLILNVNGETSHVSAMSGDVKSILASHDVDLKDGDFVSPAANSSVKDKQEITVRTARPVTLTVDGVQKTIQSTALTVKDFLNQVGTINPDEYVSAQGSTKIPESGMKLEVVPLKDITLDDGGQLGDMKVPAVTVKDFLDRRGIKLGADDKVTPELGKKLVSGDKITIERNKTEDQTVKEAVEPTVRYVDDPNSPKGSETVVEPGKAGEREVTYTVKSRNGQEVQRWEKASKILSEATEKVISRGTKAAVASTKSSSASAPAVAGGSVWDSIAQCESGGKWNTSTGNGFSGGLQFTDQTWQAFGGGAYAPTAAGATREQQIAVANKVQAAQGWGAWPACTSKLGIR